MPLSAGEWAAWAQFGAGLGTFGAAVVAVVAAYQAPKRAAAFAEDLRKQSAAAEDSLRRKHQILDTLLKHRATFEFPDAVNALNAVPIAFVEDREVRDALTHFQAAADIKPPVDGMLKERYLSLIEKIVRNLGLGDKITVADVNQGYYPNFLAKQRMLLIKKIDDDFEQAYPGLMAQIMGVEPKPKNE